VTRERHGLREESIRKYISSYLVYATLFVTLKRAMETKNQRKEGSTPDSCGEKANPPATILCYEDLAIGCTYDWRRKASRVIFWRARPKSSISVMYKVA
jgi:hypothetical protein